VNESGIDRFMVVIVMSGLKWWKIVLIIFIIILAVQVVYDYDPPGACVIHVHEVNECVARNGTVHLTEQDFEEYPVLVEAIKGEKPLSRMLRRDMIIVDHRKAVLGRNSRTPPPVRHHITHHLRLPHSSDVVPHKLQPRLNLLPRIEFLPQRRAKPAFYH